MPEKLDFSCEIRRRTGEATTYGRALGEHERVNCVRAAPRRSGNRRALSLSGRQAHRELGPRADRMSAGSLTTLLQAPMTSLPHPLPDRRL